VETNVKQMDTRMIEDELNMLEDEYANALKDHSDLQILSRIWKKIKELKEELKCRKK
jgi:hypothetical protein